MRKISDLSAQELADLLHLSLGEARAWFETAELLASGAVLDSWMNWFRLSPKMHLLLPSIRHLMRVSVEELEWLVHSGELYRLYPYYEPTHPPRAHIRWRQLEDLLSNENEFETRYPAAHKVLFGSLATDGLALPSFGIRVQKNDPGKSVLPVVWFSEGDEPEGYSDAYSAISLCQEPGGDAKPKDDGKDDGDAYSVIFPGPEPGEGEINRSYSPLDVGYLRGLLLAVLSRDEHAHRIEDGPHARVLIEGLQWAHDASIRVTDLRLARDIGVGSLNRQLRVALETLPLPVSAHGVLQWKRETLRIPEEDSGSDKPTDGDATKKAGKADCDDYLVLVSFAAAAVLLFIDFDMPRLNELDEEGLHTRIVDLHSLIRTLDSKVDDATGELDKLLANRAPRRQRRNLDSKHREALLRYQRGCSLESIADWWVIKRYKSQEGRGTTDWESRIVSYIRRGAEVERERYPEVADILERSEDPTVKERAHRVYQVLRRHPSEFSNEDERLQFAAKAGGVDTSQDMWREITDAYGRIGACHHFNRPILP